MKKVQILLFALYSCSSLFGQLYDNNWMVGSGGPTSDRHSVYQLDFRENPMEPQAVQLNADPGITFDYTTASFSDAEGELLFYTNGLFIKNRKHEFIEGGEVINPGNHNPIFGYNAFRGAFFLPAPGNDSLAYLIHFAPEYPPGGIEARHHFVVAYYTLIEIHGNGGDGKVLEANVPIIFGDFFMSSANRHANGRDWWILTEDQLTHEFHRTLLNPDGFTYIGSEEIDSDFENLNTFHSFSPNGKMFASYSASLGFSLFDFDRCTGELSRTYRLNFNPEDTVDFKVEIAFSQNNRFLYVAKYWQTYQFGSATPWDRSYPFIIQYDLFSNDIALSADTVGRKTSDRNIAGWGTDYFLGLQLGPDGKIYSFTNLSYIHSIQEPNRKGKACRMMNRFPVIDKIISTTFPYYPNYRLGPIDNSPCDTLKIDNHPIAHYRYENWDTLDPLHIEFADLSYYEPAEWFWEFENLGTSRDTNPEFTFPAPGIYEVCLTVSNVNSSNRTCKNVPVGEVSDVEEAWEKGEPVVFPNPTSNAFQIYNPTSQVIGIQLFNVSVQCVFEKRKTTNGEQIDVSFLPEGIYFYSFLNEENQLVKSGKLIISR